MPKEEIYNITVRVHLITKSDNNRRLNTYVSLEGYTYGKETIGNRFSITDGFIGRATSGIKEKIGNIILTKAREMVKDAGFSDTRFQQVCMRASGLYPMKVLHTQWVMNAHPTP